MTHRQDTATGESPHKASRRSFREFVMARVRARFGDTPPRLGIEFPDGASYELAPEPLVTIAFHSRGPLRDLARGNISGLGDAYTEGELTVRGDVGDVIEVGVRLADAIGRMPVLGRASRFVGSWMPRRTGRRRAASNVAHHYDVSNAFYRLWLDRHMVYSCAYFPTGRETIDSAQEEKLDHICRKLRLAPGERLLDIGCGWGGLLRWAAARHGIRGVGITLSRPQYELAVEQVAADGLADRVEIRLQDYRDVPEAESFDKIVSVGMYEHVGLEHQGEYFRTAARLLKPGGALLNHGIVATDPEGRPQGPVGADFIDRHVFPGGALPPASTVLQEIARSGLETVDMEDLRPHYARTLQRWVRRLEASADAAAAAAGARHYRIWRIYMAGMAYAFDRRWLSVIQTLAYKPEASGPARRPWTRAYQYPPAEAAPLSDGLDWQGG